MRSTRKFAIGWLVVGALQALFLQGCESPTSGDQLFSSAAPGLESTSEAAENQTHLRVSLPFFEGPLNGTWGLSTPDGQELRTDSSQLDWQVGDPVGPAPRPGYIADFRDRPGCESFQESSGLTVCFTYVPDVSSIDVRADKVTLQGVQNVLSEEMSPECASQYSTGQLNQASYAPGELELVYQVTRTSQPLCPEYPDSLLIRIRFS